MISSCLCLCGIRIYKIAQILEANRPHTICNQMWTYIRLDCLVLLFVCGAALIKMPIHNESSELRWQKMYKRREMHKQTGGPNSTEFDAWWEQNVCRFVKCGAGIYLAYGRRWLSHRALKWKETNESRLLNCWPAKSGQQWMRNFCFINKIPTQPGNDLAGSFPMCNAWVWRTAAS